MAEITFGGGVNFFGKKDVPRLFGSREYRVWCVEDVPNQFWAGLLLFAYALFIIALCAVPWMISKLFFKDVSIRSHENYHGIAIMLRFYRSEMW